MHDMDSNSLKVKAVAYARVSTLLGQDPEHQLSAIRKFANAREFAVVKEYIDQGISGTKERRPSLDKMVRDAQSGKFKVIIIVGIDRLARDTRHLLNLINELNHYGVAVISLRENIDFTTPMGQAALAIFGAMASLERSLISERIKTALAAKKLAAQNTGSGWRCGRPTGLTKDKESQILNLHNDGHSIRAIARRVGLGKTTVHRFLTPSQKPDENGGDK